MGEFDTIAAISTPLGEGGIGIIRVSGDMSGDIAKKLVPKVKLISHTVEYGKILDPDTGNVIDEVLILYMKSPRSYTREDVVEIHCHGGIIPVSRIMNLVIAAGARVASPGEFTKRAFLNGRVDLSQAEAVMDIIRSKTDRAMDIAVKQLAGDVSKGISTIMEGLIMILANIEAAIDFPEEDTDTMVMSDIAKTVDEIISQLIKVIEDSKKGRLFKEGILTAIIGKPNVGKSSLLNAMVRDNRAIVTHIPGTTRDIIEEIVNIKGIPLRIADTAGIRDTDDFVEQIGVSKSVDLINKSDLILFMLDGSQNLTDEDSKLLKMIEGKNIIVIINKTDLEQVINEKDIKDTGIETIVRASMISGEGLDSIEEIIIDKTFKGEFELETELMVTSMRHLSSLNNALSSLKMVKQTIEQGFSVDFVSIDIKGAWESLGEITGDNVTEDIVDRIFRDFCIGK